MSEKQEKRKRREARRAGYETYYAGYIGYNAYYTKEYFAWLNSKPRQWWRIISRWRWKKNEPRRKYEREY